MKIIALSLLFFFSVLGLFAQSDEKLASQYVQTGEVEKAVNLYQKLFNTKNNTYYTPYFDALLSAKKFDTAEEITQRMIKLHPRSYQYAIALGRVFDEKGEQEKADALYTKLVNTMPAEINSINDLATQFVRAQNQDWALKTYLQGRKLLKNDELFAWEIGNLYRSKNNRQEMLKEYLTLLKTNAKYLPDVKRIVSTAFDSEKDNALLQNTLQKMVKQYPDKDVYAELLIFQLLQQKQFRMALDEAIALSRRRKDNGNGIADLCHTLLVNEAYDEAMSGYQYMVEMGKKQSTYLTGRIGLINAKNLKITSRKHTREELYELEKDYVELVTELGQNLNTAPAMENLAKLQVFRLKKLIEAEKTLSELIAIRGLPNDFMSRSKLNLGDLYLINDKPWEATLMYSQVDKAFAGNSIAQEAKFRNAKLAYYTGDFAWAKRQLDELKAETAEFIDNDALNLWLMIGDHTVFDSTANPLKMYARADLLIFKEEPDKAMATLDSIDKAFPLNDLGNDIAMAKARIFIQKNEYLAASEPLKKIAAGSQEDIWADDALFMLGDIYENHLQDRASAQTWYQKLITDHPASLWINEVRKRFRALRGDDKASL